MQKILKLIKRLQLQRINRIQSNKIMRRSSKPTQLITQTGQDQTYRFRCMQYLNFVLNQVVNQENRFKLYSSHIEHLLRSNLNDITIQDIEKIKRMLDEGEKQKIQTQQTGDFINYDLIDKMKYSHHHTHYYLQQAPQQSLLQYYGPNNNTIQEVQQIKNRIRQQKLQENNYKMLDLMFKLPQDYQNLQDQIQKQIENQQEHQRQIMKQENQQRLLQQKNEIINNEKNKSIDVQNIVQQIAIVDEQQKHIQGNQIDNKIQQIINQITQNRNQNIIFSTPEKQNNHAPISDGLIDIPFVQIKKKKSNKKKPPLQQKPITSPIHHQINPQQQQLIKFNQNAQNGNLIQIDQQANILTASPQKRKYIRKKPLQQKKAKSQKSKSGEKEVQNRESELLAKKLQLEGEVKSSNEKSIIINDKKHSQQNQKKPKKIKKTDVSVKKPIGEQELQIMLPYPQCQQQVKQLKKQIQELNKRLQNEKQQFLQNRQHALTLLTKIKKGEHEQLTENNGNMEIKECKEDSNNFIKKIEKEDNVEALQMRENHINRDIYHEQNQEIKVHKESNSNLVIIMPTILNQQHQQQQIKKQKSKKPKTGWKPSVLKKESKKSSSEQYKPPQDEIQSVYEIEKDGKLVLIDQSCDKKKNKKQKKKDNKKAIVNKKNINKNNQQCVVLQTATNRVQPSLQIINNSSNFMIIDNILNPSPQNQIVLPIAQIKQKKTKLSAEQRQRIKQQKQKLKQMRLRQKQEKKKLKQLQKLQKETLKLAHKLSEKSSAKELKSQSTNKKAIVSTPHIIKPLNQSKKQTIQMKIDNKIQQLVVNNNEETGKKQLVKPKNILDESIGMNSTKQDIRMNYSLASAEKESGILKRVQPIQSQDNRHKLSEQDIVIDVPKKKIKQLQCKEPIYYENPHHEIESRDRNIPKHLVQILQPDSPSSPQPIEQQFLSHIIKQNQHQQIINREIIQQQKLNSNNNMLSDDGDKAI